MIEITCIECGHKFNKFTGDMDERTCLTCILKEEDPDVIWSGFISNRKRACFTSLLKESNYDQGET